MHLRLRHLLPVSMLLGSSLLTGCGAPERPAGRTLSLTGYGYTGKKYYFGWGAASGGDPSLMHNEVKYDVLHTHKIFTTGVGGDYISNLQVDQRVDGSSIRSVWQGIKSGITNEDMYVQYSSGHGHESGLAVGVSYDQMRDHALGLGAKETIILTMACHSGALVDSFNRKRSEWQNFKEQGRTLFVMASSKASQLSSTGPGRDSDESGGPNGSAGSAFGHSLWKALIGYSDGFLDGVKDGFVSLGEIEAFTKWKVRQIADHDPVVTGVYDPNLIMNRVPSRTYLASIGVDLDSRNP